MQLAREKTQSFVLFSFSSFSLFPFLRISLKSGLELPRKHASLFIIFIFIIIIIMILG